MDDISKFEIANRTNGKANKRALVDVDKYVNEITRAVKAVIGQDTFFKIGNKNIDENGNFNIKVYVDSDYESNVQTAIDKVTGKWNVNHRRSGFKRDEPTSIDRNEVERNAEDARNEARERKESERTTHAIFTKMLAVTTLIADVTRRILSSVINGASKALAEGREAGDYGMSYSDVRKYQIMEKTYGIEEGTSVGAISDIQSKFGNIVHLDENALADLALVMGSNIIDLINTGMGGDNPDKLMEEILNSYFNTAMSGYNSIGQYVGQDQARRELVEQLKKISPDLSKLLSAMLEANMNQNSIYYGRIDSFGSMKAIADMNRLGLTDTDLDIFRNFGDYANQLKGVWEDIKKGVTIKASEELLSILKAVADSRLLMDSNTSLKTDETNAKNNLSKQKELEAKKNELVTSYNNTFRDYFTGDASKVTPTQMLRIAHNMDLTDEEYASLGVNKKDIKTFNKNVKEAYESSLGNTEFDNIMAYIYGIDLFLREIASQNAKGVDVQTVNPNNALIAKAGSEMIINDIRKKKWSDLSSEAKDTYAKGIQAFLSDEALGETRTKLVDEAISDTFYSTLDKAIKKKLKSSLTSKERKSLGYDLLKKKPDSKSPEEWVQMPLETQIRFLLESGETLGNEEYDFLFSDFDDMISQARYEAIFNKSKQVYGADDYNRLIELMTDAIYKSLQDSIQENINPHEKTSDLNGTVNINVTTDPSLKATLTSSGSVKQLSDNTASMDYHQAGGY